jgi:hypothetical protein
LAEQKKQTEKKWSSQTKNIEAEIATLKEKAGTLKGQLVL